MRRARRYYTGQTTWKIWEQAGVVGTKLRFTDDDIITQQTLARTADVMKNCRAMDAAVAYELGSVGADTEGVSPKDLLSDYTRAAYLIEDSRAIGYGQHSDNEKESCGHDEVNTLYYRFNEATSIVYFSEKNTVVVATGSKLKSENLVDLDLSDVVKKRLVRCREDGYHNTGEKVAKDSDLPMQVYEKYLIAVCPSVEEHLKSGAVLKFRGVVFGKVKSTLGACKLVEGKKCRHHNELTTRGWAMYVDDGELQELYTNAPCASIWNNDMLLQRPERESGSKLIPATGAPQISTNWLTWDSQRRSMIRNVDDKKVLSLIRKALGRMSRRNWGVVSKMYLRRCLDCGSKVDHLPSATNCSACDSANLEDKSRGNNAIYKWSDWGWLASVHAWIQTTRSKNRKAGDIENGWEWFAHSTKQSYGMDMSEFAWRPANDRDTVMHTFSVISYHNTYSSWRSNEQTALDFSQVLLFHTKEAAEEAAGKIISNLLKTEGAVVKSRVYTEGKFAPQPNYKIQYQTVCSVFQMKPDVEPEDYMSPSEINKLAVSAAPQVLENHIDKFTTWDIPVTTKTVAAPESDDE